MVNYFNDGDECYDGSADSHLAVITCFLNIFRYIFSEEVFNEDIWAHRFKVFIELGVPLTASYEYWGTFEIAGRWNWEMMDDDGNEINGIPRFSDMDRYVAYLRLNGEEFYLDSCPYTFPAVFYSKNEIEMWLLWALKKKMTFQPRLKPFFTRVIDKLLNENELTTLFKKKLSGEIPWEYGPARVQEPNAALWRERTRDPEMNKWILQWLD